MILQLPRYLINKNQNILLVVIKQEISMYGVLMELLLLNYRLVILLKFNVVIFIKNP